MTRIFFSFILAALMLAAPSAASAQTQWHDPEDAGFHVIQGQKYQGEAREGFYHRFPARAKSSIRDAVWKLSRQTAGESIVFTTDAKSITVRYTVPLRHAMPHMPATGVTGVDLYTTDRNGDEVWLAAKYSFKDTITFTYSPIEIEKKPKAHRYTLFLPLYNEVSWMEIGVEEGAKFRFEPVLPGKPIVAYGTSICQGACASRPGMAWSNILQRRLGHEFVNLGFSGNAFLDKEVIDLIADIDAEAYIIDAMPNSCSMETEMLRDTLTKAVRQLRSRRPDTPIILADHIGYPHSKAFKIRAERETRAWEVQKAVFDELKSEGDDLLYHLPYDVIALPQDGTVEGVHASDYGMMAYATAYEKILREVLDEPVGHVSTTIPVTQQRDPYNWMDRHAHIINESHGKHYTRVLIGDSIMHFWGDADDAPAKNGQEVWNEFDGTSLNMGCGYDRVENVLWRIYHGQLDGLTADRIFLAIGTNNLASDTPEEIIEGLRYVIEAIKVRRPEASLTLMGILPRRGMEAHIKSFNRQLRSLAKDMKINFADPGRRLLHKNGKIDESLFTDGLHPNVDGYRLISDDFR